jgi:hypothetical protein
VPVKVSTKNKYGIAVDFRRMQMQKDVRKNAQGAISRGVVVLVAEDRSVDLRLGRILERFQRFFCFGGKIGFQRLEIFFDTCFDCVNQADGLAIFTVRVFLIRHFLCSRFFSARTVLFASRTHYRAARCRIAGYTCKNAPGSLK